jgi:hypothetical protein
MFTVTAVRLISMPVDDYLQLGGILGRRQQYQHSRFVARLATPSLATVEMRATKVLLDCVPG